MTTSELLRRFEVAADAVGAKREASSVFRQLHEAYLEPHRKYHGIAHIEHCLATLDGVRGTLRNAAEVELALWFHDAVYATGPLASNEEKSARLAEEACARMGVSAPVAARLAQMVRATKDHTFPSGVGAEDSDMDMGALFDIDLGILGAPPLAYATFERDVRAEYAWVPEFLYRSTRAKILARFLERPALYHHPKLRERFEARARENLARALSELGEKSDRPSLHATDDALFLTRWARLEAVHPWSELHFVTYRKRPGARSAELQVAFGPFDDRIVGAEIDDPAKADVIARLRSLPGYRHDLEASGGDAAKYGFLYSAEDSGVVKGPVPLPASVPQAAFRS